MGRATRNVKPAPTTDIPSVPVRTSLQDQDGNITRTWILFFEQLAGALKGLGGLTAGSELKMRTLLLKDTTVGNDIADVTTVYASGTLTRVVAVLRDAITADLTVRININGNEVMTCTVPQATAINTPVTFTPDEGDTSSALKDGDVLTWDVVASDGSKDVNGIASFSLMWV